MMLSTAPPLSPAIAGNATVNEGADYSLQISPYAPVPQDASDFPTSWSINWGDGTSSEPDIDTFSNVCADNPPTVTHVYAAAGNYSIQAIVTDGSNQSDTVSRSVQVCDPAQVTHIAVGSYVDESPISLGTTAQVIYNSTSGQWQWAFHSWNGQYQTQAFTSDGVNFNLPGWGITGAYSHGSITFSNGSVWDHQQVGSLQILSPAAGSSFADGLNITYSLGGDLAANADVSICIDGQTMDQSVNDSTSSTVSLSADDLLALNLADGAHSVRLYDATDNVYSQPITLNFGAQITYAAVGTYVDETPNTLGTTAQVIYNSASGQWQWTFFSCNGECQAQALTSDGLNFNLPDWGITGSYSHGAITFNNGSVWDHQQVGSLQILSPAAGDTVSGNLVVGYSLGGNLTANASLSICIDGQATDLRINDPTNGTVTVYAASLLAQGITGVHNVRLYDATDNVYSAPISLDFEVSAPQITYAAVGTYVDETPNTQGTTAQVVCDSGQWRWTFYSCNDAYQTRAFTSDGLNFSLIDWGITGAYSHGAITFSNGSVWDHQQVGALQIQSPAAGSSFANGLNITYSLGGNLTANADVSISIDGQTIDQSVNNSTSSTVSLSADDLLALNLADGAHSVCLYDATDNVYSAPITLDFDAPLWASSNDDGCIAPVAGQSFSGEIATFTDDAYLDVDPSTIPNSACGDYGVTIFWGDSADTTAGDTTTGSITLQDGVFTVSGTHTYTAAGYYSIAVTITDLAGGASATASTDGYVGDASGIYFFTQSPSAQAYVPFSGALAYFNDGASPGEAGDYLPTVTIDGNDASATVVPIGPGLFAVVADYTIEQSGTSSFTVDVQRTDITGDENSTSGSISVAAAPPSVLIANNLAATRAVGFSGMVATFTSPDGDTYDQDFSGTIDWGDYSTLDDAQIGYDSSRQAFTVSGSHTYAHSGFFQITVTIDRGDPAAGGAEGSDTGSINVAVNRSAPPASDVEVPDQPTGLTATAISTTEIGLVWEPDDDYNTLGYDIYRADDDSSDFALIATVDAPANSFVDDDLHPHTNYQYKIMGFNDGGLSSESTAADVETDNTAPVAADDTGESLRHDEQLTLDLAAWGTDADGDQVFVDSDSLPSMSDHGGSLTLNADGTVTYVAPEGYVGPDHFTYSLSDGRDLSALGTVDIIVTNALPEVSHLTYDVAAYLDEDGNLLIGSTPITDTVPVTDLDQNDGTNQSEETFTYTLVDGIDADKGTFTLDNATGEFSFTPSSDLTMGEQITATYTVSDGADNSNLGTITFLVGGCYYWGTESTYSPPTVSGSSYALYQGQTLSEDDASGLLCNATDPQDSGLSVTETDVLDGPMHGTLSLTDSAGAFTYTPDLSFAGRDWFTYAITNGYGLKAYATAFIDVEPVQVGLTAHRTGLKFGDVVSEAVKRGGNSANYLLMVDDADHLASDTVDTLGDDTNLAQIELTLPPADLHEGTLSVEFSDGSTSESDSTSSSTLPVRVFDADGHLLSASDLTMDLAHPGGFLAGLPNSDGTLSLWLQGVNPCPDLKISIVYYNLDGDEISRDDVHMDVFQWDVDRKDGQVNATIYSTGILSLLDAEPGDDPGADTTANFRNHIIGLADDAVQQIHVYGGDNPADRFEDTISGGFSSHWIAAYAPDVDGEMLSASQRATFLDTFGLNAVDPNSGGGTVAMTLLGGLDAIAAEIPILHNWNRWSDINQATGKSFLEEYRNYLSTLPPKDTKRLHDLLGSPNDPTKVICTPLIYVPLLQFAQSHNLRVMINPSEHDPLYSNDVKCCTGACAMIIEDIAQLQGQRLVDFLHTKVRMDPKNILTGMNLTKWKVDKDNMSLVPEICVGDIVDVPQDIGPDGKARNGHTDIIASITDLVDGHPTLTSKVHLLLDPHLNRTYTIEDLLTRNDKEIYGANDKFYQVRRFDFSWFSLSD